MRMFSGRDIDAFSPVEDVASSLAAAAVDALEVRDTTRILTTSGRLKVLATVACESLAVHALLGLLTLEAIDQGSGRERR